MASPYPSDDRIDADSGGAILGATPETWREVLVIAAREYVSRLAPEDLPDEPWTIHGSIGFIGEAQSAFVAAIYRRTGR